MSDVPPEFPRSEPSISGDSMPADGFTVVRVSSWPGDMWPLSGPYVEHVWCEILGPTATLLVRRLGRCVDEAQSTKLSFTDMGTSLGVSATKVVQALRRLHMHHFVVFSPERAIVGVSGFAPSVRPGQRHRLSAAAQAEHRRLFAEFGRAAAGGPASGQSGCCPAPPARRQLGRSL